MVTETTHKTGNEEKINEIISIWLEDIRDYSETDIVLNISKHSVVPSLRKLEMLNADNYLDPEINKALSLYLEYFIDSKTHLPDLLFTYLNEETQLFVLEPKLKDEYLFNVLSFVTGNNLLQLIENHIDKDYKIHTVDIVDDNVELRFFNVGG